MPPNLREPLTVIQEEAERASGIVKNLLGFARKQEHQRRPTALKSLLDATFVLLRNQLMAQRIEYRLEAEPDLPMPVIDSNQIQQVFVNLITNAAQAVASSRPARDDRGPAARRWLDGVAVDVIDNGPGMPESLASQVFEPFFTTKPEGHGTGLGLSISQGIVKEHGGRIMLTTEEGKGCTFTVQLPLGEAPAAAADKRRRPGGPGGCGCSSSTTSRTSALYARDAGSLGSRRRRGRGRRRGARGCALPRAVRSSSFRICDAGRRRPRILPRSSSATTRRLAGRLVFSTGDTVRGDTPGLPRRPQAAVPITRSASVSCAPCSRPPRRDDGDDGGRFDIRRVMVTPAIVHVASGREWRGGQHRGLAAHPRAQPDGHLQPR